MISENSYIIHPSPNRLMTVEQSAVLYKKRNELILKAVLSAALLGICALWSVLQAQTSGETIYYAIALCLVVTTAWIGMDVVDLLLAIQSDLKLSRIALAQGHLTPQTTYLYDMLTGQHTVAIGEGRFRVLDKRAPVNVEYCRVIYAPVSRIVLGVEA